MDQHLNEDAMSRRALMRHGVGLGMGVLLLTAGSPTLGATRKISQAAIGYVADSTTPGETCARCRYYIAASTSQGVSTCQIVEGPVDPRGHCREYSPEAVN